MEESSVIVPKPSIKCFYKKKMVQNPKATIIIIYIYIKLQKH